MGLQPAPAVAQSIRVERLGPSSREVDPGQVVTLIFRVTNDTGAARDLEPELIRPEGWRSVMEERGFRIEPSGTDTRLLSLSVPAGAPAGEYGFIYRVRDARDASLQDADSASVVVAAIRRLGVELLSAPRFAIADSSYKTTFLVTNLGNEAGVVDLNLSSSDGLSVRPDTTSFTLAARESRRVAVTVETPAGLRGRRRHEVRLRARLASTPGIVAEEAARVDVVAQLSDVRLPYRYLPAVATLRAAGEDGPPALQAELRSSTVVPERPGARYELHVRTPDLQSTALFGLRDLYRFQYDEGSFRLRLGDHIFALSPLTEYGSYGMGAGVEAARGRFTAGTYVHRERYSSAGEEQAAGFVAYRLDERAVLRANVLRKRGRLDGGVGSLQADLVPWKGGTLELESAFSGSSLEREGAYSARLSGTHPRVYYNARYIYAGPQFPGYYRNVRYAVAGGGVRLIRDVTLITSYSDQRRNPFRDPAFFAIQHNRNFQVGLQRGGRVSLLYRAAALEEAPRIDRRDQALQLRVSPVIGLVTFHAQAEAGVTDDRIASELRPFQRYSTGANLRLPAAQSLQLSADYYSGSDIFTGAPERRWSGFLSGNLWLTRRTALTLMAYGSRALLHRAADYGVVDASIVHTLPLGHQLTLRGRKTVSDFTAPLEGANVFSIEYAVPFRLPAGRVRSVGSVRGSVLDAETGAGVPNVLLYLGDAAMATDPGGTFVFPALQPGRYFLQVDQGSLGMDRVIARALPVTVDVVGGQSTELSLTATTAAALTGRVVLHGFEESGSLDTAAPPKIVEEGGLAGVLVELVQGDERRRRMTDAAGRFTFDHLWPGAWTLRMREDALPPFTYLEQDSVVVELIGGQVDSLELDVLPRRRRVRIIEEGRLSVEPEERPRDAGALPPRDRRTGPDPEEEEIYVVKTSDVSLMDISRKVYDAAGLWPKIWVANRALLPDPDRIRPGLELRIPPKAPLTIEEQKAKADYYR